jgi:hypothetical protein
MIMALEILAGSDVLEAPTPRTRRGFPFAALSIGGLVAGAAA